ncbi:MAG: gamma-glutamylcyclotransferase family protein [Verrucomicrobiota bacterium JB025]|nr:gamma-glutamylcyclotransferase family protein [Verrucomicrobiota bacterium JB025]
MTRGALVFVYGTLRRGASNHFRMDGARFVAEGTVGGRIFRIDWYPGLVLGDGGERIVGEVFEVGPELLAELDVFEGVSAAAEESEYRRVKTEVRCADGTVVEAWVWEWLGESNEADHLAGGDWLAGA